MMTARPLARRFGPGRSSLLALIAGLVALDGALGQATPQTIYACYVPLTGTVYRVNTPDTHATCTSTAHVLFSWVDGANAVHVADPLGGDLYGVFSNASVVKLLGRALSATAPSAGQALVFDGTSWTPTTIAGATFPPATGDVSGTYPSLTVSGLQGRAVVTTAPTAGQFLSFNGSAWQPVAPPPAGVTAHGALTGLLNDDHTQYLLVNGVRAATNGFAVTGTQGTGTIPVSGAGTRLMWYAAKGAFRSGRVAGTEWDNSNVGPFSVAMGEQNRATGEGSTALGAGTLASGDFSIAMGQSSTASGFMSVATGFFSTASGSQSTAMGQSTASGAQSTAMGLASIARGDNSTAVGGGVANGSNSIAMGYGTAATGSNSTAVGYQVQATGAYSIALGSNASTNSMQGAFVYGDASSNPPEVANFISATAPNQFAVRASGGFQFRTSPDLSTGCNLPAGSGTFSCTSSRFTKEDFTDLNGDDVLAKLARMPIQAWSYKTERGVRHVGPTAQDFRAAFGLGPSDESISLVDIDGINLLGVQTLERRTRQLEQENADLRARLERLEALLQRSSP